MAVRKLLSSTVSAATLLFSAPVLAQDGPKNAFFGELHLHTAYSLDAYQIGTKLDPFGAYRFARGEEVETATGGRRRIVAPLDFAAVTDHAEELGEYETCTNPDSPRYDCPICRDVRDLKDPAFDAIYAGLEKCPPKRLEELCGLHGNICTDRISGPWKRIQQAANEAYRPGKFTTLIGYEYTAEAFVPERGSMHRNVIFRTHKVPDTVFSAYEGTGEDLQAWLERTCTGDCKALTIPHNPNRSWGRFYWGKNSDGSKWNLEQIKRRARYDRLVEIMQIKGSSECQTYLGTTDEECNFEIVPQKCEPGEGCITELSFVRTGLKLGLRYEKELGTNPFKHGFVGATDNHNGMPSDTSESDYGGYYGEKDYSPKQRLGNYRFYNPGAITGVWASENTRESIWDALHRRETFATSGTRITARLIGGFSLSPDHLTDRGWVRNGVAGAVPQGGDLRGVHGTAPPTFAAYAARDPNSATLAKLQIVKGWTKDKLLHEVTYDIACSGDDKPNSETHRCPDNGASVNLKDCELIGDGAPELTALWTDPDFDPNERAFYYLRVLENPVCRWSMHDAMRASVEHPAGLPKTVKERAWTSPIWYKPKL